MFDATKIKPNDIGNYITNLTNNRMKQMNDFIDRLEAQKKDDVFYSNALNSIQTVIEHFDIVEEAFEGLSKESLTMWGDNSYHLARFYNFTLNEGEVPKYTHYFDLYNFKTNYIVSPLVKTFKNYTTVSECTINMTKEGMLISVVFSEDVTSQDNKKVSLTYNDLFELVSIRRSYQKILTGEKMLHQKSYCEHLSMEAYFIDLFLNGSHTTLREEIPELSIDSAYNFNSDEFNIRLKVAEMMMI
jgi:hypothetical protein